MNEWISVTQTYQCLMLLTVSFHQLAKFLFWWNGAFLSWPVNPWWMPGTCCLWDSAVHLKEEPPECSSVTSAWPSDRTAAATCTFELDDSEVIPLVQGVDSGPMGFHQSESASHCSVWSTQRDSQGHAMCLSRFSKEFKLRNCFWYLI